MSNGRAPVDSESCTRHGYQSDSASLNALKQLMNSGEAHFKCKNYFAIATLLRHDNPEKAIHYLKLGAEKGEANSAYQLAAIYSKKSSSHFNPHKQAIYIIQTLMLDPQFRAENKSRPLLFDWLKANSQTPYLLFALIECFLQGYGVAKNPQYVTDVLLPRMQAMALDDRVAKYFLGKILTEEQFNSPFDFQMGVKCLTDILFDKNTLSESHLAKAVYSCLESSALKRESGHNVLYLKLGLASEKGLGVNANAEKARGYYDTGIQLGDSDCAYQAALLFETGQPELAAQYAITALRLSGFQNKSISDKTWVVLARLKKRYPLDAENLLREHIDVAAAIISWRALQEAHSKDLQLISKEIESLVAIADKKGPMQCYAGFISAKLAQTLKLDCKSQKLAEFYARAVRGDDDCKAEALARLKALAVESTYAAIELKKLHDEGLAATITIEYFRECEQKSLKRHRGILNHVREKPLSQLGIIFANLAEQRRIITLLNPTLLTVEWNQEFAYLQRTVSNFLRALLSEMEVDIEKTFTAVKPKCAKDMLRWVKEKNPSIERMVVILDQIRIAVIEGAKAYGVRETSAKFYARWKCLLEDKFFQGVSFPAQSVTTDCLHNYSSEPLTVMMAANLVEPPPSYDFDYPQGCFDSIYPAPSFLDADFSADATALASHRTAEDYIREGALVRQYQGKTRASNLTAETGVPFDWYLLKAEEINQTKSIARTGLITHTNVEEDLLLSFEPITYLSNLSENPLPSVLSESIFPKVPTNNLEVSETRTLVKPLAKPLLG